MSAEVEVICVDSFLADEVLKHEKCICRTSKSYYLLIYESENTN